MATHREPREEYCIVSQAREPADRASSSLKRMQTCKSDSVRPTGRLNVSGRSADALLWTGEPSDGALCQPASQALAFFPCLRS